MVSCVSVSAIPKPVPDNYTFSINGDDAVRALKFVADETTATITDASLVIVTN